MNARNHAGRVACAAYAPHRLCAPYTSTRPRSRWRGGVYRLEELRAAKEAVSDTEVEAAVGHCQLLHRHGPVLQRKKKKKNQAKRNEFSWFMAEWLQWLGASNLSLNT